MYHSLLKHPSCFMKWTLKLRIYFSCCKHIMHFSCFSVKCRVCWPKTYIFVCTHLLLFRCKNNIKIMSTKLLFVRCCYIAVYRRKNIMFVNTFSLTSRVSSAAMYRFTQNHEAIIFSMKKYNEQKKYEEIWRM